MNVLQTLAPVSVEGNLLLITNLIQVSVLACLCLMLASRFRHSATRRYLILYSGLIGLILLVSSSTFLQLREIAIFDLSVEMNLVDADLFSTELTIASDMLPALEADVVTEEYSLSADDGNLAPSSFSAFLNYFNILNILSFLAVFPFYLLAMLTWVIGMSLHTFGLLRSFHHLERIVKSSQQLSPQQHERITQFQQGSLESPNSLRVRTSKEISSPMLIGIFNPVVVVPGKLFDALDDRQLQSVLIHEEAHRQRHDSLANLLQQLIRIFFWFHPLVQLMSRQVSQAREEICDNYVLVQDSPLHYGEVLFRVSTSDATNSGSSREQESMGLAVGVLGSEWRLEQRISDLLNDKRETAMNLNKQTRSLITSFTLGSALILAACQVSLADGAAPTSSQTVDSNSSSSQTSSTDSKTGQAELSPNTLAVIENVQELMSPSDDSIEPDYEAAKQLLDELYQNNGAGLNSFEKQTALNFYTNYYLSIKDYPGAIDSFEMILNIDELREDIRNRALRSLGQLTSAEELWQESIDYYTLWQSSVDDKEDDVVYRGLSYAHYQLENYLPAIDSWKSYLALQEDNNEVLERDDYAYLNGLYFQIEDYESALDMTKEMVLKFNSPTDWENLRQIFLKLEEVE